MKTSELKAKAARYMKIVEWSDEDGCFVGSAPPLIGPCCHGKDEAKVYAKLCRIVEERVEILETDGHELPGPTAKKFSHLDAQGTAVMVDVGHRNGAIGGHFHGNWQHDHPPLRPHGYLADEWQDLDHRGRGGFRSTDGR